MEVPLPGDQTGILACCFFRQNLNAEFLNLLLIVDDSSLAIFKNSFQWPTEQFLLIVVFIGDIVDFFNAI